MVIIPSTKFLKNLRKLPKNQIGALNERLELFTKNEFHPLLNNHKLHGEYKECRSINVTGDIRLVFKKMIDDCILVDIGTHSDLYE